MSNQISEMLSRLGTLVTLLLACSDGLATTLAAFGRQPSLLFVVSLVGCAPRIRRTTV